MKKRQLFVYLPIIMLSIIYSSCYKFDTPSFEAESFSDLQVPSSFNWNTSQVIEFTISSNKASIIKVTSTDGSVVYHTGFYNKLADSYTIKVSLPTYVQTILVNNKRVSINTTKISVDLDDSIQNTPILKSANSNTALAFWHFNEAQGKLTTDENNAFEGTITNANWATGVSGSCLDFAGEDGNVEIPNNETLNITDSQISHSLWFKLDYIGASGVLLFHRVKYIIRINEFGKIGFGLYTPEWDDVKLDWDDRILDTDWHHIVTTYNGETLKLYLDGQLMASKAETGNIKSNISPLYIGSQDAQDYFEGKIDEVAIYGSALSSDEISTIFNQSPNMNTNNQNKISSWMFHANRGYIAEDYTGENNGTIHGAKYATGVTSSALEFNGESDYVEIPNADNLNPTKQFTLMAWVKSSENKTARIAQKGDWDGFGIYQDVWSGWKTSIRCADDNSYKIDWQNGVPLMDEWYHICASYNGSQLNLFVNGQLCNTLEVNQPLYVNSRAFTIGSDGGNQKFLKGSIDDIIFYGSSLDATEIQCIYKDQSNGTDSDGDGIPNLSDEFPNDPGRAFTTLFPAAGFASLAFEDLWPSKGDYDFNDLVLDYQFSIVTNAKNKVSDIEASFVIKAIGAVYENGFGFQFGDNEINASEFYVTGSKLTKSYISLQENGLEDGIEKPTFIVFDNALDILKSAGGVGVNVDQSQPYISPETVTLHIALSNQNYSLEDLNLAGFNPFLMVNGERGREIHLPGYKPTSLASKTYFGTYDDNTNFDNEVFYKSKMNHPWAIHTAERFDHVLEKVDIIDAYLQFTNWAQSGGSVAPDWYLTKTGYRNETIIYTKQ